ncbi:MAG: RagB/SusD family nutrient uptake outer membrane protein [Bacteroidales bacterium]|nr:RagB/SusD family nutrient uptake outer membrane protein [Bacteroidales bacterium]
MKKTLIIIAAGLYMAACSWSEVIPPQGEYILTQQVQQTNDLVSSRADATFNGMYTKTGAPGSVFGGSRPDDFGFIMMAFSNDIEAADIVLANSGYNWFSACGMLTSRNADYANPYIRYAAPYNTIAAANEILASYSEDSEDESTIYKIAQARAMRAFAYLNLAPYFQFGYAAGAEDLPCIPIVTEKTTEFTDNPRATVAEVYELIISDLDYAIGNLDGYVRTDKSRIDIQTAYGLRARAYLNMQEWGKAAADAAKAAEGYSPATMDEAARPSFIDISEHSWIWGYDMTPDIAMFNPYATSSAWIRSFSGDGYSAGTQVYACINKILYDKIPETDIRKGWWVDENLESPLLATVTWNGVSGNAVAPLEIDNVKMPFLPYTNVKFGMYNVGGTNNDEDWPYMRVEEMILIQAEGLVKSGAPEEGRRILEDFVRTYRDPGYSADAGGRSLDDEIWFQRRIELWGEGFSNNDTRRLNKPLVRFHGGQASNVPEAFRFNMTSDDGWWLMRFTSSEMNTNLAITDNTGGTQPVQEQNPGLMDGVTD